MKRPAEWVQAVGGVIAGAVIAFVGDQELAGLVTAATGLIAAIVTKAVELFGLFRDKLGPS